MLHMGALLVVLEICPGDLWGKPATGVNLPVTARFPFFPGVSLCHGSDCSLNTQSGLEQELF